MILTINTPVALSSDSEGLRSTAGNSNESTDSGLFGQILNSQETVSAPIDEAVELLLPFGRETTGGTLLPGGGKQLPQVVDSDSDPASLELTASLLSPDSDVVGGVPSLPVVSSAAVQLNVGQSPLAELPQILPADGEPIENIAELISLSPDVLARLELNPETGGKIKLPGLEQVTGTPETGDKIKLPGLEQVTAMPKIIESASQPTGALVTLANVTGGGPELAAASSVRVALSNRDPLLPPQPPGQSFELDAEGDKVAPSRFGPVVESPTPIAQKPDITAVVKDVSADSTEAFKSLDGLPAKTVGSNAPASSTPLALGIAQNVNEATLPSGVKATSLPPLATAVGDPKWSEDFAGRIGILVDKGVSEAKLQLTPAELGRMEIKISTDGDQAKILFTVQNATAREAIEQAMPRLREMLAQEGLQLAHSEVADHSASQDNNRNLNPENLTLDSGGLEDELDEFLPRSVTVTADTMVDYYV